MIKKRVATSSRLRDRSAPPLLPYAARHDHDHVVPWLRRLPGAARSPAPARSRPNVGRPVTADPTPGSLRIAAIQHDIAWNDREANFAHLAPRIAGAAANGAELVVLSETFSTGFAVDVADLGEAEGGASAQFLLEQAAAHGVWVAGSCPEIPVGSDPADTRPANSLVFAGPDGSTVRYHKIHPFTYGGETEHFRPGAEFQALTINGVRITPFVCYDLRFADEFWQRALATDVYIVPANWPSPRRLHWQALLRARAIENLAYVVGCNRVGSGGGGLEYSGDSAVIDPLGEILASGAGDETTLFATVDAARVAEVRARFRFLDDRR